MSDFEFYLKIKQVEHELNFLGMELSGSAATYGSAGQQLAVRVKEDADYTVLPPYTRGAMLMSGSLREIECWIIGYKRAMGYVDMLGLNVKKAEDKMAGKLVAQKLGMQT